MKIAIVCGKLNYGGAERVAVTLANGFSRCNNNQVTIITNLNEKITYQVDVKVKLRNLVSHRETNKIVKWIIAEKRLRAYLRKDKPDVIIGIMQLFSFISIIASRGMRIPVIMTEHNSFERPQTAPFSLIEYLSKFYLNRIYRHVTVLTTPDKEIIKKKLKHIEVMPNPLAIQRISSQDVFEHVRICKKKKIILACGRLDDWYYKGFDVLLKAWGQCCLMGLKDKKMGRKDFTDGWSLQIAGGGTEKNVEFLKGIANSYGVGDRTLFLGFKDDIISLYLRSEIFIMSSRYEGFGLVLIEAMSQGCACIACDYNGRQKEIVGTEENGLICEPDDSNALAENIKRLITDDEYRYNIQKNAIARSDFFSIENTMVRWNLFLKKVIDGHK